jgi:flagellar hook-basal body complex protein FliE
MIPGVGAISGLGGLSGLSSTVSSVTSTLGANQHATGTALPAGGQSAELELEPGTALEGTSGAGTGEAAGLEGIEGLGAGEAGSGAGSGGEGGFGEALTSAISSLDQAQQKATGAAQSLATGGTGDPEAAVATVEEAQLAMQLASQIRTKATESIQTLFQTQV